MADINNNNKTALLYAKGKTNLIHEREKKKYFSRTGWENWKGGRLEKIVKKKKHFLNAAKKKSQQSHIA